MGKEQEQIVKPSIGLRPGPDEPYNENDYRNGYKIIESFADYAKREKSTDIICTTEY